MFRKAAAFSVLGFLILIAIAACSSGFRARLYSKAIQDNNFQRPVQIASSLFYVGSSDISSFLFDTGEGLVLIDAGYTFTVPKILENIDTLGYEPSDITLLLNTHSHMDHAAGLAEVKRVTGAQLFSGKIAKEELVRGGRNDFFLRDIMAFEPVSVDRVIDDFESFEVGNTVFTMHHTPGHTKGCTSWAFETLLPSGETEDGLLICSLSILRYRLVDNKAYPGIASDFKNTFDRLDSLPCNIFLAPHARLFDLKTKSHIARENRSNPYIDPAGCKAYIGMSRRKFERRFNAQSKS